MPNNAVHSVEWTQRIEELVRRAEAIPDLGARSTAIELLQAVLEFHAAGLRKIFEIADVNSSVGRSMLERVAADDLAGSLLLLHDLHPDDLPTRIERALNKLQEMFSSLGARLSLISLEAETVRLQFESARAWAGTPVRESVENAIFQAAPEVSTVVIEGLKEPLPNGFVPVSDLLAGTRS